MKKSKTIFLILAILLAALAFGLMVLSKAGGEPPKVYTSIGINPPEKSTLLLALDKTYPEWSHSLNPTFGDLFNPSWYCGGFENFTKIEKERNGYLVTTCKATKRGRVDVREFRFDETFLLISQVIVME
jgi:hypothetical protein